MASLAIKLFALFALLLAVTATTTAFEDDNERCPQSEMSTTVTLNSCRKYLMYKCGMQSYPLMRPRFTIRQHCCMQLRRMKRRCRCAAICRMMQDAQEEVGGYYGGEGQMTRMAEMAAQLPSMCNLAPDYCEYGSFGAC